jgi:hypothetical protein
MLRLMRESPMDLPNVVGLAFFCLADMQVAEQIKIVEGATTQQ